MQRACFDIKVQNTHWSRLHHHRSGLEVDRGPHPPHGGDVEIGYSVAPAWQGQDIAREAAAALIAQAFDDVRVERVLAHTLATENASVRVLRSLGFRFVADVMDPDDGALWKWELTRAR